MQFRMTYFTREIFYNYFSSNKEAPRLSMFQFVSLPIKHSAWSETGNFSYSLINKEQDELSFTSLRYYTSMKPRMTVALMETTLYY